MLHGNSAEVELELDVKMYMAFLQSSRLQNKKGTRALVILCFSLCEDFDGFAVPLFRVIVEPNSMATALMWFIGVVCRVLNLPTRPPLVPTPRGRYPPTSVAGMNLAISLACTWLAVECIQLAILQNDIPVQWRLSWSYHWPAAGDVVLVVPSRHNI